jgi:hypothetical protein
MSNHKFIFLDVSGRAGGKKEIKMKKKNFPLVVNFRNKNVRDEEKNSLFIGQKS